MKKNRKLLNVFVMIGFIVLILGCSKQKEEYGSRISNKKIVTIESILENAKQYENEKVVIEGKITSECPSGCWFNLNSEGNNVIRVDLNPGGFAIPQIIGKKVVVEGKVKVDGETPEVIGEGVKIK